MPHSAVLRRTSRTYSAALAVGRGPRGDGTLLGRFPRMLRPARSLPAPGGALLHAAPPLSGWHLNLRRAVAGNVHRSARHGEPGPQGPVPGARAACPLGAETRLHRPGAAGDRAALPGAAGAGGHGGGPACPLERGGEPRVWEGLCEVGDPEYGGLALSSCIWGLRRLLQILAAPWHCLFLQTIGRCSLSAVLRGDPESQGHPATARAPGPVRALGAHLRRQPVSVRGVGREGGSALASGPARGDPGSYSEAASDLTCGLGPVPPFSTCKMG